MYVCTYVPGDRWGPNLFRLDEVEQPCSPLELRRGQPPIAGVGTQQPCRLFVCGGVEDDSVCIALLHKI